MRTLIVIVLALCCAAASVRIEGVWPPESLSRQIEHGVTRVAAPGTLIRAIADLHRQPSLGQHGRSAVAPAAFSQSGAREPVEKSRADLACG